MDNPATLQEELEGYCGLGMYDEALRRISVARRKGDKSLTLDFLRTRILRAAGRFVELRKTAEQLRRQRPEEPEVWVSLADAVRRLAALDARDKGERTQDVARIKRWQAHRQRQRATATW